MSWNRYLSLGWLPKSCTIHFAYPVWGLRAWHFSDASFLCRLTTAFGTGEVGSPTQAVNVGWRRLPFNKSPNLGVAPELLGASFSVNLSYLFHLPLHINRFYLFPDSSRKRQ